MAPTRAKYVLIEGPYLSPLLHRPDCWHVRREDVAEHPAPRRAVAESDIAEHPEWPECKVCRPLTATDN